MFRYTSNNEQSEEIKKTIPFTTASKRIKYPEINLTKEVKDLYSENCKILRTETGADTNKWKRKQCPRIDRSNNVKMATLPEQSTDSMQSLSRCQ